MCGVCGFYNFNGQLADPGIVKRMVTTLRHRGPDDQGLYTNNSIALGMTRLAIIDLSQAAHQPMSNSDGTVWIVYNGEVYNHLQLKKELEEKGYRYHSKSDTETVLHLYEEYGTDCLTYLRGMYAFAIWDNKRQKLFLAVDRLGIKPLYYTQVDRVFIFGSELKAILQHPNICSKIDLISLDEYMRYSYVPAPRTIFKDIKKLPPAHYMIVEEDKLNILPYWDLQFDPEYGRSETEWVLATRELLTECVDIRLMSDVPLGALLSGGLDSSSVVALMSQVSTEPVKSFTIGFQATGLQFLGYDERYDAQVVSENFHTNHYEMVVEPKLIEILPSLIWHFDEPFSNETAIPTYYLSEMVARNVTVALGGVGGDEVFGGYPRYQAAHWLSLYFRLPVSLRERLMPALVDRLPEGSSAYKMVNRIKKFFGGIGPTPEDTYYNWMSIFDGRLPIYSQAMQSQVDGYRASLTQTEGLLEPDGQEFLNQVLLLDIKNYLPYNLLTYTDRMSMAHSLEVRVPFCDHKLVEFAATIPPELKVKGFTLKYLLKRVMRDKLPNEILNKRKQGFSIPLGQWLRDELRPLAEIILSKHRIEERGYFEPEVVAKLWSAHLSGRTNYASHLWALIVFDLWHTLYIDEAITSEPSSNLSEILEV